MKTLLLLVFLSACGEFELTNNTLPNCAKACVEAGGRMVAFEEKPARCTCEYPDRKP